MMVENVRLRLISAPYFLATKLVAFENRGKQDYSTSRDLEDIVALIDGRPEITSEVSDSEATLRDFLRVKFQNLLSLHQFLDSLPGYLLPDKASQQRLPLLLRRMRLISGEERLH
jgi:hypothetical protein